MAPDNSFFPEAGTFENISSSEPNDLTDRLKNEANAEELIVGFDKAEKES